MKDYSVLDNMIRMVGDTIKQAFDKGYKQGDTDGKDEAYQKGLNDAWEAARKLTHPRYGGYYDDTKLEIFDYRNSDDVLTMLSASEVIAKIKEYEEKKNNKTCDLCIHCEMCAWIDKFKMDGCEFFDDGKEISRIKEYEEEQAKISEEQMEKNIQRIFGTEKKTKKNCHNCGKTSCGGRKDDPDIPCLNWVAKQTNDEIRVGDEVILDDGSRKSVVISESENGWNMVDSIGCMWTLFYYEKLSVKKTGRHFDAIEEVLEQMRENDND